MTVSLQSQIAEVERELKMRRSVYAHQVATRKLRQAEADLRMKHMEAALATLRFVEKHADVIRSAIGKDAA